MITWPSWLVRIVGIMTITAMLLVMCVSDLPFNPLRALGGVEKIALASLRYAPTSGALVIGNDTVTPTNTNLRSYRGAIASDTVFWSATNNSSGGLDMQVYSDNVVLNGANKLIISYRGAYVTTATNYQVQIYDWVGGVWRNMVDEEANLSSTTQTTYAFELYDGFFQSAGNPVVTPMSNFVSTDANKRVAVRVYSTVASTTQFNLDYVSVETAIDPIYAPASFTQVLGGTPTGTYNQAQVSDNARHAVPGTAALPSEFYYSFKNVNPYAAANAILVAAEDSGSATGFSYNIRIYNFTSSAWEPLNSTVIASSTTDGVRQFAKSNVNLSDYVSGGEVRVGYLTTGNTAQSVRVDRLYIMIGSVNADDSQSETSWGTVAGGTTAAATRDLDTTAAVANTWQQMSELEYPASGLNYPSDNDGDGTGGEAAFSSNLSMPVTVPSGAILTGVHWAARYRSNSTTMTVQLGVKDYSGYNNASVTAGSGWRAIGTTNATANYTYSDSAVPITGVQTLAFDNPQDYIDTNNDLANLRLRTSASTNTTAGTVRDWDFAMVSIRWLYEPGRNHLRNQYGLTSGALVIGNDTVTPTNTNLRSYRGAIASDTVFWSATNNSSGGLDMQVYSDNVVLNGANKLIISYRGAYVTTATNYQVQIYDWVGGVWRNMVDEEANLSSTTQTTYAFELYDGFFQSAGNPIVTPMSNFVSTDANKRVAVRVYSTVASTTQFNLDYINVETAIDPIYAPASFTQVLGGTPTGTYNQAQVSDNARHAVPGTAALPSEFYYSFKNVNPYAAANAILVAAEDSGSATGFSYNIRIYNFTSSAWEPLNSTVIASSTTDGVRQFAKSNVNLSDYVSGGEVRVGYLTTGNTAQSVRVDRLYIMIGSVNADDSQSETSWGTVAGGTTAAATRDLDTTAAVANTWQQMSELEYPASGLNYPSDNDGDGTGGEAAFSSNLSMPVTVPSGAILTGVHWAARYRSNSTTMTVQLGVKDYSGYNNASVTAGSGWRAIGTTNATANYTYSDSAVPITGVQTLALGNPQDYIDTNNNIANLRLRTSASTNTTAGTVRDWDFAMVSCRYIGASSISLSIDESYDRDSAVSNWSNSVSFGVTDPDLSPFIVNQGTGNYAVLLTVNSNIKWDYMVQASQNLTTGSSTIPINKLEWDQDPGSNWIPFSLANNMISANNSPTDPGGQNFKYDYRLNISMDNSSGNYGTTIIYTALASP